MKTTEALIKFELNGTFILPTAAGKGSKRSSSSLHNLINQTMPSQESLC